MRDAVIVTTYNRPEMLEICLEYLSRCKGVSKKDVWVSQDIYQDDTLNAETEKVISKAKRVFTNFTWLKRSSTTNWGNIHQCLCRAYDSNSPLVYFIEDDIIITDDFFEFCEAAFKQFKPFAIVGENRWEDYGSSDGVGLTHSDFQVTCGCITHKNLGDILKLNKTFTKHWEEVMQNHIIKNKRLALFPSCSRAFHLGYYSARDGDKYSTKSLSEKRQIVCQIAEEKYKPPLWSSKDLVVEYDRRPRWQKSYNAQAQWGF